MGFWPQALISFLIWIAVGWYVARNGRHLRTRAAKHGLQAAFAASMALFVAIGLLFISMSLIANQGGFSRSSMALGVWFMVTLTGSVFIAIQTAATIVLTAAARQAAVTSGLSATSSLQDSKHE